MSYAMAIATPRVPAEVRGKMRILRTKLNNDYKVVIDHLAGTELTKIMISAAIKNSKLGRQRALNKAQKMLPGVRLEVMSKHFILWSILRHRIAVLSEASNHGEKQDAITMEFIVAGSKLLDRHGLVLYHGLWSLEIPDHAIARMYHRSPNIDVRAALYEAHQWLMLAKSISPLPYPEEVFFLPAGNGVFLGHIISGVGESSKDLIFYYRAKTWLHNDQLYENQRVMEQDINNCFGKREMLPCPLRLAILKDEERVVEVLPLYKPFLMNLKESGK